MCEEALKLARKENQPRFESIGWYLDTTGLGKRFNEVIDKINITPKLYPT